MNTSDYINWVQQRTGQQTTNDEMRVLVNTAQNKIFSYNTNLNKKKPEQSCTFDTQANILQYSIADTQIMTITSVWAIDSFGKKITIPVEMDMANEFGDSVTIYFPEDPGETTKTYYFDAYLWPFNGQITSTSIPLSVPERVQTELLFNIISKMLEVDKDGRSIYNDQQERKWLLDYFNYANQGAKPSTGLPDACGV
jgi:hypothetical protein